MIHLVSGNLLESAAEALVNAVNTVGVMGAGIALDFKKRFPENFRLYESACKRGEVCTGKMFVVDLGLILPKWIINFPTKRHWRNPSRIEWIRDGTEDLRRVISEHDIKSIAIPPLGCGLGGLSWNEVHQIIESGLTGIGCEVFLYEPLNSNPENK